MISFYTKTIENLNETFHTRLKSVKEIFDHTETKKQNCIWTPTPQRWEHGTIPFQNRLEKVRRIQIPESEKTGIKSSSISIKYATSSDSERMLSTIKSRMNFMFRPHSHSTDNSGFLRSLVIFWINFTHTLRRQTAVLPDKPWSSHPYSFNHLQNRQGLSLSPVFHLWIPTLKTGLVFEDSKRRKILSLFSNLCVTALLDLSDQKTDWKTDR